MELSLKMPTRRVNKLSLSLPAFVFVDVKYLKNHYLLVQFDYLYHL